MVAGCGTDAGKTVTAAVLTTLMQGDYWKPVQCSKEEESDSHIMQTLLDRRKHHIFKPAYSLNAPVSPHHAAKLENISIDVDSIILPKTSRPLIIEGIGGILVPLTQKILTIDLFKKWKCQWVVVSKNYIGSINHTLLTLDVLKKHNISIAGIIFNGEINRDTEDAILEISKVPYLGRLLPEKNINIKTIQRYAELWQPHLSHLLR